LAGLSSARRPYVCQDCQRELTDASNFRPHMVVVHKKNTDGSDADDATITRFKGYVQKGSCAKPTKTKQTKKTATDDPIPSAASATAADEPIPCTSAMATATRRQRRPKESVAAKSESTTTSSAGSVVNVAEDLEMSSSSDDSSNDFFVDMTDEEGVANAPIIGTQSTTRSPTERVPTRPSRVVTPRSRVAKLEAPTVVHQPSPTAPAAKRRRLELAPSVLAQRVMANPHKSSRDLVGDLASKYSWTPAAQRDRVNVIRGMRAMAAAFSARIRRRLPLNRT